MTKLLLGLLVCACVLLFATTASAQTPADVLLMPEAGVYTIRVELPSDLDVASTFCRRVDVTPWIDYPEVAATPSEVVDYQVTIVTTPNDDAEVRCFAVDTSGNVSDQSPNAAIVDFTRPGAPRIQPSS